jgi:hypothetical protein
MDAMIRIVITVEAFEAIKATLATPTSRFAEDQHGEDLSDVIVRLATEH